MFIRKMLLLAADIWGIDFLHLPGFCVLGFHIEILCIQNHFGRHTTFDNFW
jgi:hypothetical protein